MPPLLLKLSERKLSESLDWLGVSYGLTPQLHKFWKRAGYVPVYIRQTASDLTGEHTCIMLKQTNNGSKEWLSSFSVDFKKRFLNLLAFQFSKFSPHLVLGVLEATGELALNNTGIPTVSSVNEVYRHFSPFDLKRLDSYSQNLLDYHVIIDLVPTVTYLYFMGLLSGTNQSEEMKNIEPVKISAVQSAILISIGTKK